MQSVKIIFIIHAITNLPIFTRVLKNFLDIGCTYCMYVYIYICIYIYIYVNLYTRIPFATLPDSSMIRFKI